jgi:hypothetical protein
MNAYRILVGKPEGNTPLVRPRRMREDNIKMDIRDIEWGGMDWIDLAQDRDRCRESPCKHGNEPSSSVTCWKILE